MFIKAYKNLFKEKGRKDLSAFELKTELFETPLMLTIPLEAHEIFDYLLGRKVDVNQIDGTKSTALITAIKLRHEYMVKKLLEHGAQWEYSHDGGFFILSLIVQAGLVDSLKQLYKLGARIHATDKDKNNLLHLAATTDKADIIGILLDLGVDNLAQNRNGMQPADKASRVAIQALLSIDHADKRKRTVLVNDIRIEQPRISRKSMPKIEVEYSETNSSVVT